MRETMSNASSVSNSASMRALKARESSASNPKLPIPLPDRAKVSESFSI